MRLSAAILGASGYAGGELIRLLDTHPVLDVGYLGAHTRAGSPLAEVHPNLAGGGRLLGTVLADDVPDVDVVFLALPHGASAVVGEALANRGMKVVDLGSDFRLNTRERYQEAYGSTHPLPEQLGAWVYGLPEIFGQSLAGADRVAAPGCYPTAAVLALAPLLAAALIASEGIVVNAVSGVSGAGRSSRDDLLFGAVDENVGAYAIARHRHRPEIEMALEMAANGRSAAVTFTPHLVPMQRGILATSVAPLTGPTTRSELQDALQEAYSDRPFVDVIDQSPQTRWVIGSNRAIVSAYLDPRTDSAVVISAIDNLVKGAAGQAIQDANLMLGLEEAAGLPTAGWMP